MDVDPGVDLDHQCPLRGRSQMGFGDDRSTRRQHQVATVGLRRLSQDLGASDTPCRRVCQLHGPEAFEHSGEHL